MSRRSRQNIIFLVLGMIGIGLIAIIALVYFKQRHWRGYENETAGFGLKYPPDWSYVDNRNGAAVIFYSPIETDLDAFQENFNIVIQNVPLELTDIDKYTNKAIEQMKAVFKENFEVVESSPMRINGQMGYKLVFIGKGPETELKYQSCWFLVGDTAYQLTYTALASKYDKFITAVNRMVSSFHRL